MEFFEINVLTAFLVLAGLFTLIVGMVFLPSIIEAANPTEQVSSNIESDQTNDPRSPAVELRSRIRQAEGRKLEGIAEIDLQKPLRGEYHPFLIIRSKGDQIERVDCYSGAFFLAGAIIGDGCRFGKLAANGYLELQTGTTIKDWLDVEGDAFIHESCSLGQLAAATQELKISKKCTFKSLLGNPILTISDSFYQNDHSISKNDASISQSVIFIGPILSSLPPHTTISKDLIVKGDMEIGMHSTLEKNIKVKGKLTLNENVTILGNIIADGDIEIGPECKILGNIFSQKNITVRSSTTIGQEGSIKSIIGVNSIALENNVRIFGYAKTYEKGLVL